MSGGDARSGGGTERFVIVGCGAAKRDGSYGQSYPAKDLYTSTYFEKKREYAEVRGDQWMILSAEHGLVPPNAELRPYETSIDDLGEDDLDQLAHEVGMDLIDWVAWEQSEGSEIEEIVVLAGKKYIEPLRQRETFHAGIEPAVVFPLQQNDLGGIGEQMSWLKSRVEAQERQQTKLVTDGGTAHPHGQSALFDRWLNKASENIEQWGVQDERTLLLAIQEELGELTQAHLEADAEGGDEARICEELDDIGAPLLQLHIIRHDRSLNPDTDR